MTADQIKPFVLSLGVAVLCGVYFYIGYQSGGKSARLKLSQAQTVWEKERTTSTAAALAESEVQRAREQILTEKLTTAAKERDDAKTHLAAAVADRSRIDRQLRDARAAITAAFNRQGQPAAPACHRAADATLSALGGCAEAYRGMAYRYGECLAGMQLIEKSWNAARDTCR